MDSRKQFEEWYSKKGKYNYLHLDLVDDEYIYRSGINQVRSGEYVHESTQDQWMAWQASRESLVVELPRKDPLGTGTGDCGDGRPSEEQYIAAHCNAVLTQCQRAIERQGITWK
jgi:hypothetical protein